MMASDSDESDYEDARQHHDNENEDNIVQQHNVPDADGNQDGSGNSSRNEENRVENNDNRPLVVAQEANGVENPQEDPNPIAANAPLIELLEPINENENENPNPIIIFDGEDDGPDLIAPFVRYAVDSDDDDVETISDDSEVDFPMLNDEGGGATSDENDAAADVDIDEERQEFDQELPIRHAYLGEGMEELQGRVVLEEDATPEIPLIAMGIHLIPGQTLPLTIFHAVFQNAIRRCVMTDRLFGIVHNDMEMPTGNMVYKGALGTLAEIFEYQEESDGYGSGSMSSNFALKAKGRQRFNVLEVRRQADGNLMGKVRIRPEIKLEPFVINLLLPGTSRCYLPKLSELDVEIEHEIERPEDPPTTFSTPVSRSRPVSALTPQISLTRRDSLASTVSSCGLPDKDLGSLQFKIKEQRRRLKYYAALTPHPYFIYEHFDETVLVEKVHRLLKTELKGLTESRGKIPTNASDLSFWLAQNLTMDDSHRTKILKMDSSIQRLRYELELLGRTTKVIGCRNCQTNIADHSQIFAMSIEGPQGTYVNPHGFVHETLTVHKVKELITRGLPSTEASWFPGYSWTIAECKRCKSHIGWKFQAVGKLKPPRFWGLARRSVIFKYDFGSDSDIRDSVETHRTPPNSANSEAFATVALF